MADSTHTRNPSAIPQLSDIFAQLRDAGVEPALITKTFDHVETARAEAIAEAARLFYRREDRMTSADFVDELGNMKRRAWALNAAVCDVLGESDCKCDQGVVQLSLDVARELEQLAEAFQAERWLARGKEAAA